MLEDDTKRLVALYEVKMDLGNGQIKNICDAAIYQDAICPAGAGTTSCMVMIKELLCRVIVREK